MTKFDKYFSYIDYDVHYHPVNEIKFVYGETKNANCIME
jgi:hypothetical protein